ncbi:helix-turn-helix domain-containing protein [Kutzneria viridogrisea]|uniref:Uncharacterized protein n=2 Tax=Kutzneria TaxID=43356 RepID=W5WER6_9PSEU|nr:PucR family transcriptional regulator [Kutzneria albida]AHH99688.1 hypothetical protein KALB_6328 [Kutzneria albida DSM 43870]MBA8924864.1 hypothetical protein [Kutzneria viridogrisea]
MIRADLTIAENNERIDDARQLWARVSAQQADMLRPYANSLARDIIAEIQRGVPAYAQPLRGKFGQVLVGGVERAILQCFESSGNPEASTDEWAAWFRYSGRVEFTEGRTMDALQTAVRIGARVAWRHLAAIGRSLGMSTENLLMMAEAIFAYVDELSAVAIEGYTEAQAQAAGTFERRRRQLLKLVLAEPTSSAKAVRELAAATQWPVPTHVAAVAFEYREDQFDLSGLEPGGTALVDFESDSPCMVTSAPEQDLRGHWGDRRVAVGPTVPLAQAARSLHYAQRAILLAQRGIIQVDGPIWCHDHLSKLMLFTDEFLLTHLTRRSLHPFEGLTVKQRERLSATLLAWLDTHGGVNEIAARLDIHPQTVRYRMHQIEELVGPQLSIPEERLKLEIALRAEQLLAETDR